MARRVRVEYPGAVYHVIARGNNRSQIFVTDAMRLRFLDTLGDACRQTGWVVHAYVLMRTHYHLLLESPEANLVGAVGSARALSHSALGLQPMLSLPGDSFEGREGRLQYARSHDGNATMHGLTPLPLLPQAP